MSDLRTTLGGDRVGLRLQHDELPRDAVYAAAFSFIDRCYVHLDRIEGDIAIELRAKTPGAFDAEAVAAEIRSELFANAFRIQLAERGNDFSAAIVAAAVGAPAPGAGAGEGADPLADLAAAPFDDPLGIAMSWEEKHAKKDEGSTDPSATTAQTEPQALGEGEQAK